MYMCMYVCMYVCIYMCMHICKMNSVEKPKKIYSTRFLLAHLYK